MQGKLVWIAGGWGWGVGGGVLTEEGESPVGWMMSRKGYNTNANEPKKITKGMMQA